MHTLVYFVFLQVSVDGALIKSNELFSDELSLTELKVSFNLTTKCAYATSVKE